MTKGLIITLCLIFSVPGCYIAKQSYYQLDLIERRKTFWEVLADPGTPEKVKEKIKLVMKARNFAVAQLKLKETDSYLHYIQLDDSYVAYNVSASPKDKLRPIIWDFPVVGQVPYLGFFKKEDAIKTQQDLIRKDYDTKLSGVPAYSTLGFFEDPLFSSMLLYPDFFIVNIVIHEMTHGTIFIRNHVRFNEALATFVGNKGARLFFEKLDGKGSKRYQASLNWESDNLIFSGFIERLAKELEGFYKQPLTQIDKLKGRELIFKRYKDIFKNEILPQMKTKTYKGFLNVTLNNAVVLSFRRYYEDLKLFEKLYQHYNQDLNKTVSLLKKLESYNGNPQKFLIVWLESQESIELAKD